MRGGVLHGSPNDEVHGLRVEVGGVNGLEVAVIGACGLTEGVTGKVALPDKFEDGVKFFFDFLLHGTSDTIWCSIRTGFLFVCWCLLTSCGLVLRLGVSLQQRIFLHSFQSSVNSFETSFSTVFVESFGDSYQIENV